MPYKILRKRTYFSDLDENVSNKRRCDLVEVKEPNGEKTINTLSPSPPLPPEKMSPEKMSPERTSPEIMLPEEFSPRRYPSL